MRIAIVTDIHGNLTALEAVIADLKRISPDVVLHGGDLADAGSSPIQVVDRVRDLDWQGVMGNTDEMLVRPDSLREFAEPRPHLQSLFAVVEEMAAATREALGSERLVWLGDLPRSLVTGPITLVHASPQSLWHAPEPETGDAELESIYTPLDKPFVIYGHIHRSFIRTMPGAHSASGLTVANAGSVGLSYDGDPRASYLLLDDFEAVTASIRRVEYDVEQEIRSRLQCGLPHAGWIAKTLKTARPQMP